METLIKIQNQVSEKDLKKEMKEEKDLDEFERLKKQISREIKEVRKRIEERNELLGKTDNNTTTVKMSSDIRNRLKEILKNAEQLQQLQQQQAAKLEKKKSKGKKVDESLEREVIARGELVELAFKHIEECKQMEKSGYKYNSELSGYDENLPKPTITSLPDIDDDGFRTLRDQDRIIDQKLELVGEGVNVLKQMANQYTKEIEMQDILIKENEHEVDKTQATLDNLNKRMKNLLEKTRSCDRFVLDFILIVIILAIGLYIYNMVAG